MPELRGTQPYTDNRMPGDPGRGPVDQRESEYGGIPGVKRHGLPMGPPGNPFAESGRLRALVKDRLRVMMGNPSAEDLEMARRTNAGAHISERIDQRLAAKVADTLASQPDGVVRSMLPGAVPERIPSDPAMRWMAIGSAALDAIHKHVDHGDDAKLSPHIAREARLASLRDLDRIDIRKPLDRQLQEGTQARSNEVRNYLSTSLDTEIARERHARSPQADGRTLHQIEREMAEARLGYVPARDMLARSREFAEGGRMAPDQSKGRGVTMPQARPNGLPPQAREEAIAAEIARGRTSERPDAGAGDLLQAMAARAHQLAHTEFVKSSDIERAPLSLSKQAQLDMGNVQHEWKKDMEAANLPSINPPNLTDELSHRYMAIMLRDAYATHPSVAKALDNHADAVRRTSDPAEEARRGVDPYMDASVARRLTIVSEAQGKMDGIYREDLGWKRRGAELQHVYAKQLDLPDPSRAQRMAQFAHASARETGPRVEPVKGPSRAAAMASFAQGRAI